MTAVGFIIQPGESIPEDVDKVKDGDGDEWEPAEVGWSLFGANPDGGYVRKADVWVSKTFGPLTVTAVREQPAAEYPRCDACGSEDPPDGCHIGCPKLAAAPLVLSLPEGTTGLVGVKSGRRYARRAPFVWEPDEADSTLYGLQQVLAREGSVSVVMAPPEPTIAEDFTALHRWICRAGSDEGDEAPLAALRRLQKKLEVLDDKDSTR